METNVIVVDSVMGSGKSNFAIEYIKCSKVPVIYVTPYLDEVKRFTNSISNMYEPQGEIKSIGLMLLLKKGRHIATTHSLFSIMNEEVLQLAKEKNYVLILDEVIDAYQTYPMTKQDYKLLKDNEYIFVDKNTDRIYANTDEDSKYIRQELFTSGVFNNFFQCIDNNMVYEHLNTPIVEYPIKLFKAFKDIIVLTYMFEGATLKSYFKINNIKYELKTLSNDTYKDDNRIIYAGNKFKDLITFNYSHKNDCYSHFDLSATWYKKHISYKGKDIGNSTRAYFRSHCKAKQEECLYTTYKEHLSDVRVSGYVNSFVPMNLRATNKYSDKKYGAYLVNRFLNPIVKKFILHKGGAIDENVYALSEMLQWIWRLRIRNGESIKLYIPSPRMKRLLVNWLNRK